MTTFYLLRHGTKEGLLGDPPLSQLGITQAEVTSAFLKPFGITAIYASPSLRTKQTAQIVGKTLNVAIVTDERLRERMNWGDQKDKTFKEFMTEWDKASRDRKYQPLHGDSAYNTGERLKNVLLEAEKKHNGKNILVVTHGGTIGDFLQNTFTNLPLETFQSGVAYVQIIECSLTTIIIDKNILSLREVGSITHLQEPLQCRSVF